MSSTIQESLIIKGLVWDNEYFLKCMPRISENLFQETSTKRLFKCIQAYYEKYNKQPTTSVIDLFAEKAKNLSEDQYAQLVEICDYIRKQEELNIEWMSDATIQWIRERTYYEALIQGAEKFGNGELDTTLSEKLDAALGITFDNTIGMELSDAESRWETYVSEEEHIPFDLEILNKITKGGVTRGTLNLFMSSDSGGFKSGTMCHIASGMLRAGYNILYVSFEMAEDKIMERIDANLLDTPIDDLKKLGKDTFVNNIQEIVAKTTGRLIVKQYPTSQCHVGHIRYLLKELKLKKNFKPDVIFLDYLNIMASSRLKGGEIGNSYGYVKAVAEEVRGIAIEQNVPVFSATQSNRGGMGNEDLSLSDISESVGTIFTCDLIIGIITTPEFDSRNVICYTQLKNRYADKNYCNKWFLGVDKSRMKLFEMNGIDNNPSQAQRELESERENFALNIKNRRKHIEL